MKANNEAVHIYKFLPLRPSVRCSCVQGKLRGRTFSQPRKSMKGKGRITVQFGCCYNYAVDQQGRKPGTRWGH